MKISKPGYILIKKINDRNSYTFLNWQSESGDYHTEITGYYFDKNNRCIFENYIVAELIEIRNNYYHGISEDRLCK